MQVTSDNIDDAGACKREHKCSVQGPLRSVVQAGGSEDVNVLVRQPKLNYDEHHLDVQSDSDAQGLAEKLNGS